MQAFVLFCTGSANPRRPRRCRFCTMSGAADAAHCSSCLRTILTPIAAQAKIEAQLGGGGAPVSKVIHKGKVLEEGKPVSDYGVADADMFVVMVSKAKPKPAAAAEPAPDAAPKPVSPTAPAAAPAAAAPASGLSVIQWCEVEGAAPTNFNIQFVKLPQTFFRLCTFSPFKRDYC